jgi:hypothetical protein
MRNIVLILVILCSFSRCVNECETCGQGKIMENYVLKYDNLSNSYFYIYDPVEDSAGFSFKTEFHGGTIINCLFPDNNEKIKSAFRRIAAHNGDTAFYRPISQCFPFTCLSDKAGRFDIYCDMEYAGYPAETPLNEICTIYFYSAEEFVRSNYVAPDIDAPVKQYRMPLNEFNSTEHYLMAATNFYLVLSVKPDNRPAEYLFTLVYSFADKQLTHSIHYTVQ